MTTETPPGADAPERSLVQYVMGAIKSKGLKYSMVSVVNVVVGQSLLLLFQKVFGLSPTWANVLAVCISAVPAYYLSRAWVWGRKGKSHFKREVLPFWVFVAIGLAFSTICVNLVHTIWVNGHPNGPDQPAILTNLVNIAAFGLLWVARFFLFDKLFHLDHDHHSGPFDVIPDDIALDGDLFDGEVLHEHGASTAEPRD